MSTSSKILNRLSNLDSCAVSDAMDLLKIKGVAYGIKPFTSVKKIFGKAITIQLKEINKASDINKIHLGARAIESGGEENVIVISNYGKTKMAGWGGMLSRAASLRSIQGVIVDGAVRDIDEIKNIGFPVYARETVPVTARGRVTEVSTNKPVVIDSVGVIPGDYVLADGSGVVFIPVKMIEKVLDEAEKISQNESEILNKISSGVPVSQAMDTKYENMLR